MQYAFKEWLQVIKRVPFISDETELAEDGKLLSKRDFIDGIAKFDKDLALKIERFVYAGSEVRTHIEAREEK